MKLFVLGFLILIFLDVKSQIIKVKQDGTGDFIHIQDAINASNAGDTVLVYPGIYIENVDLNSKDITIGSLTLTTGDDSYISQTIVDGNKSGSCIRIDSDETNVHIHGLSLTNGSGTNPSGLWDYYYCGGGLYCENATILLEKLRVFDNEVLHSGGGICISSSDVTLKNVSLFNNHSINQGGGLSIGGLSNVIFDSIDRCNIYNNYAAKGNDVIIFYIANTSFIVDTFTVLNPSYFHLYYSEQQTPVPINYDIQNAANNTINSDLFVNPNGSNSNSGTTPEEPLKSLNYALSIIEEDSINPKIIYLQPGTYSPATGTLYPLTIKSYVNIDGLNKDSTILDANFVGHILRGNPTSKSYSVRNLTLQNGNGNYYKTIHVGGIELDRNNTFTLQNLSFTNNFGGTNSCMAFGKCFDFNILNCEFVQNYGGQTVHVSQNSTHPGNAHFEKCKWQNNVEENGPDLYSGGSIQIVGDNSATGHSITYLINCEVTNNNSYLIPPGYMNLMKVINNAKVFYINSTIGNNYIDHSPRGHIVISDQSELYVYNSILYGNSDPEIYMIGNDNGDAKLFMYNSILQGGEEGILFLDPNHYVHFDSTCSIEDPLWDGQGYFPYMLTASSPCIDAGTLNLPDSITLPETDLSGNPRIYGSTVDMGAYEYGPWVGVNYNPPPSPIQCQPNPFRSETAFTYSTKTSGLNVISIYNIKGHKVRTLFNQTIPSGNHEVQWDGRDDHGSELPAGLYIIYLKVEGKRIGDERLIKLD